MRNGDRSNKTKRADGSGRTTAGKELMDRLTSLNEGPMTERMVHHLFQEIIDTLKDLQK